MSEIISKRNSRMMCTKRPVKCLLESSHLKGLDTPKYEVQKIGLDPYVLFKCTVTAGELTAVGTGYLQTESMQNAARCILRKVAELKTKPAEKNRDIRKLRLDASYRETAVDELEEFCWTHNLGAPEYRILTTNDTHITCVCMVYEEQSSGKGYTLEQAKLKAAYKMLSRLISDSKNETYHG